MRPDQYAGTYAWAHTQQLGRKRLQRVEVVHNGQRVPLLCPDVGLLLHSDCIIWHSACQPAGALQGKTRGVLTFLPEVDGSSSTCDCRGLSMTLLVLTPLPGAVSLKACAWIRDCFGTCTVDKFIAEKPLKTTNNLY